MSFTPSAGLNCIVSKTAGGAALPGTNWTLDLDPHAKDVSNFATLRTKVPTLLDGTLTFTLLWDTSDPIVGGSTSPTGYYAGAYITVYCYLDHANSKYFTVGGLITKITPSLSGIEDVMMFAVEVSLSATPQSNTFTSSLTGILIYPA